MVFPIKGWAQGAYNRVGTKRREHALVGDELNFLPLGDEGSGVLKGAGQAGKSFQGCAVPGF